MKDKYAWGCGYLASAVHRALDELDTAQQRLLSALETNVADDDAIDLCAAANAVNDARRTLRDGLIKLQEHGIELHWPVKEINHGR